MSSLAAQGQLLSALISFFIEPVQGFLKRIKLLAKAECLYYNLRRLGA